MEVRPPKREPEPIVWGIQIGQKLYTNKVTMLWGEEFEDNGTATTSVSTTADINTLVGDSNNSESEGEDDFKAEKLPW